MRAGAVRKEDNRRNQGGGGEGEARRREENKAGRGRGGKTISKQTSLEFGKFQKPVEKKRKWRTRRKLVGKSFVVLQ